MEIVSRLETVFLLSWSWHLLSRSRHWLFYFWTTNIN